MSSSWDVSWWKAPLQGSELLVVEDVHRDLELRAVVLGTQELCVLLDLVTALSEILRFCDLGQ